MLALADDLSGAAETACALGGAVRLSLAALAVADAAAAYDLVVDLDTRHLPPSAAADAVRGALRTVKAAGASPLLYKKVDSQLRGNLAAEAAAYADGAQALVIAPALPAARRTVADGVVHVDGVPLHRTDGWRAERATAPRSIPEALPGLAVRTVPLDVVRSAPGALDAEFRRIAEAGAHPAPDARTDADLDAVAAAVLRLGPRYRLLGSGGLAAALGRALARPTAPASPRNSRAGVPLLFVVGTAETGAARQIAHLTALGARHVPLDPTELLAGRARLPDSAGPMPTVLSIDGSAGLRLGVGRALSAALAALAVTHPGRPDLVLTGGETARATLEALGVRELAPLGEIHHGAVHSRTPDGRHVVTRPGSYGTEDSLRRIATALRPELVAPTRAVRRAHPLEEPEMPTPLPLIAVTMGDGAGIGPEVVVGALLDDAVLTRCRPVVIGDAQRLREAARILGAASCEIAVVEHPRDAEFTPGRVNVVDLGLLPADLPWGKLSPVAGNAAYEYIKRAAELAVTGEVHGICTAPLNKEALHAAGHLYPGHTELLAHLTGTGEVSMMLSTEKVKVIHVTTHIGLIDAVNRIEPGLVERTVRRGHEAMIRSGTPRPVIGVCGINPHAGENGLFGYGEEEEKIVPALEKLRAEGVDARGPLPADTAFFLASRGDYDLIVAMYHDQGHGPVKVLGIEAGVNLTVGLPVIRTSVDHGTAFDIAGSGTAEAGSMVEALRQAAEMATAPTATAPSAG
ncbi:4-hydroxythreonine-4-phosphate dehydrogenase PdxA [Streptomyces sp. NPDC048484]|uniref:4-hydroxythreonine-4-phosphate dehydrogenase PdxA n=1 Tax=Streptomyces sp. NPDC048484 TaxID=3155146 RepID=UPI003441ACEC